MKSLIEPHGGKLVNRVCEGKVREYLLDRLPDMERMHLTDREISDLEMIAIGAFSPLEGFMGEEDYRSVVERSKLANGLPWTIPITLSAEEQEAERFSPGWDVALYDQREQLVGVLHLEEKFRYDKEKEAKEVYCTTDTAHPGVAALNRMGPILLGGKIVLLNRPDHGLFSDFLLDPKETRLLFYYKGWRSVVAFQTRNPIHRAHEYIQKCALEIVDGLLVHPLIGETKKDDVPAEVRMQAYKTILEEYYPKDRTILSVFPANMRYAGPKEAIFHAIARKNYGCTHFIVGRDHAGVGNYYGTYDAQRIFDEFDPEELGITPLFFEHAFYCRRCGGMASYKTCPHGEDDHLFLSGTKVRAMLQKGEMPPPEFTRPEVAQVLIEGMSKSLES